jgi:hypothetical protein
LALSAESEPSGVLAVVDAPPRIRFHGRAEIEFYAAKALSVVMRHRSGHAVIAIIEIVSPGNENSRTEFAAFVHKADQAVLFGVHLLILDLFPPTARDPEGIHRSNRGREGDGDSALPVDKPPTCVSDVGYPGMEVYLEPVAVGDPLPDMPVFLTGQTSVPVPLEATYQASWAGVPDFLRDVATAPSANGRKKSGRGRERKK